MTGFKPATLTLRCARTATLARFRAHADGGAVSGSGAVGPYARSKVGSQAAGKSWPGWPHADKPRASLSSPVESEPVAKKRGRHRQGERVTPKGTRPRNFKGGPASGHVDAEPELLAEVQRRLREPHPFAMLAEASSLLAALDQRARSPFDREEHVGPSREEIIESFIDVHRVETSALLYVMAEMVDDELTRARIHRALVTRSHPLPEWLTRLGDVEPYRAVEQVHVLGDGDNVLLGVRLPGGTEMTVVVYIDHNLGRVTKDAFVVPEPVGDLIAFMRDKIGDDGGDTRWDDLDSADAKVRITEGVDRGAITFPPYETDTWPACRPLVEWIARLLPDGGHGYEWHEWSDDELHGIAQRFLESPLAAELAPDEDYIGLLDSLLWFGSGFGPCDPFHWSPVAVEILLADWIPRKIVAPASYLTKAPDLLRALIRFAHAEAGIRAPLTAETLAAVDTWEPRYQQLIRSDRPQGPAALLAAMGVLDPEGPWDLSDEITHEPEIAHWPTPARRSTGAAPTEVVEVAREALVLRRFRALAEFYGDGRKLTGKGNPTLADARALIDSLQTEDEMDRDFGDCTFKTKSAEELPELMFTIRWALAAGALRKEHGKFRATASWRKLDARPVNQWLRTVEALPKLGPLATFFSHARFPGSHDIVDEFAPELLSSLRAGGLSFDSALDRLCSYADSAYEWLVPYMQDPDSRRRSFDLDLDLLVQILGWAGISERSGASEEPDPWIPEETRRTGGVLTLTPGGQWWLERNG